MLMVVSPAKNLDYDSEYPQVDSTAPQFTQDINELSQRCKQLSAADLQSLMGISDKLAQLNATRFLHFQDEYTAENSRPAVFAFNGDVYAGLDAYSLTQQQLVFAQRHLRILSGLYGILRPLDKMQPYRLEMGTRLETERGKTLYDFWGTRLADELNAELAEHEHQLVINLASNEYFKAVMAKRLNAMVITPVFKDFKNGTYKIISFYAKKARGLMARYIIEQGITSTEGLMDFNVDGYYVVPSECSPTQLVFHRDH